LRLVTLKRRAEFDRVRAGRKWVAKGFILQGLQQKNDTQDAPARFGFVVGSKALTEKQPGVQVKRADAVLRNRARRRLKEAVRLVAPTHAKPNFDYVIIGRREALHQRFADLLEDMQLAFGKVHQSPRADDGRSPPQSGRRATAGNNHRETEGL
jgi:ribonuclease P protein component